MRSEVGGDELRITCHSIMASLNDSFTENTFGDLSYTFLDPVPNYLTCIICYGLLKEAVATDCCEKMFCCEHSSHTEEICPACRHSPLSVTRNRGIDSIVKDLKVFCLKHRKGCPWSGHLYFEPEHRNTVCGYMQVPCEKECGVKVERRFMMSHLTEECRLREVDCEFCYCSGTAADIALHLETCLEYPIVCPHGCELQLPRKGLDEHSSTCDEAPVPCPFVGAGCDMMPVKRKELTGHLETSVGAHLLLLASSNQHLTEEVVKLKKEREDLLERSRADATSLEKMNVELQQVKTELQEVKDRVNNVFESDGVVGVSRQLEVTKSECGPIPITESMLLTCDDTSNDDIWDVDPFVCSEEELDFPPCEELSLCEVVPERRSWVEDVYDPAVSVISAWGHPCILKYQDVAHDMHTDSMWTSPEFRDQDGYVMRLRVAPNGLYRARCHFVSVQMQIMPGDKDSELEWPYNTELDVEILNPQDDRNHCRKTMDFTSFPYASVCQPDSSWHDNQPWGILQFLNHNQLQDYLWNDTLYFRVTHA